MNKPVELESRGLDGRRRLAWSPPKVVLAALAFMLLGVLLVLALLVVFVPVDLRKAQDWAELAELATRKAPLLLQSMAQASWYKWLEPVLILLSLPLLLLAQFAARKRRLYLDEETLRLHSGLPAWLDVGPWGSWRLPYRDIVDIQLIGYRAGRALGPAPLNLAALQIQVRSGGRPKKLFVSRWHRTEGGDRPRLESSRKLFGLIPLGIWNSAQDQALLQAAYEALPLVQELRLRAVAVPALAQGQSSPGGGFDLFESPRMKALILASCVLAPMYFVGIFLPREFWLLAPTAGFWWGLGLFAAGAALLWLRSPDSEAAPSLKPPQRSSSAAQTLGHRVLVSALFGLSVAAAAFPALPLLNSVLFSAREVTYRLRADAVLEPLEQAFGAPAFRPTQSLDFWLSRKPGATYQLQMRKLPLGYWQYGIESLRGEIEAFDETGR